MALDKFAVLEKLLSQMESETELLATAAEVTRVDSSLAPGRNQSRYDSSREELGYLADGLNKRHIAKVGGIVGIRSALLPNNPSSITEGTLVKLDNGKSEDYFFILPYGGGEYIETEEGEVSVITPNAPIFKNMQGKKAGDWFSFSAGNRQTNYQILEIQ